MPPMPASMPAPLPAHTGHGLPSGPSEGGGQGRLAAAFVLAALYALVLIALRRADGSTRIAFGPWMVAGAIIGVAVA